MKNKQGLTAYERILRDIRKAEVLENTEYKKLLAYMAISAAEISVEYRLITPKEWERLTERAFCLI